MLLVTSLHRPSFFQGKEVPSVAIRCHPLPSAQVSPASAFGRAVDISPAVNDLALPEVVAADVLTERVMKEGKVLPGNLLKVYSFINHQVQNIGKPSTDGGCLVNGQGCCPSYLVNICY